MKPPQTIDLVRSLLETHTEGLRLPQILELLGRKERNTCRALAILRNEGIAVKTHAAGPTVRWSTVKNAKTAAAAVSAEKAGVAEEARLRMRARYRIREAARRERDREKRRQLNETWANSTHRVIVKASEAKPLKTPRWRDVFSYAQDVCA
jgi:outer membrane lipopolysaccharide assembly protein LptE/RlpB